MIVDCSVHPEKRSLVYTNGQKYIQVFSNANNQENIQSLIQWKLTKLTCKNCIHVTVLFNKQVKIKQKKVDTG